MLIIGGRPDLREYVRRYHRASAVRSGRKCSIVSKRPERFFVRKKYET
jgi:hypothetical protein